MPRLATARLSVTSPSARRVEGRTRRLPERNEEGSVSGGNEAGMGPAEGWAGVWFSGCLGEQGVGWDRLGWQGMVGLPCLRQVWHLNEARLGRSNSSKPKASM